MRIKSVIPSLLIAAILVLAAAGTSYAQSYDRSRLTRLDHTFTIGFERQVYSLYKPGTINISNKTKTAEEHCNRIILRMKLTSRFRLETGLSYRAIDQILKVSGKYNKCYKANEPCKLAVPLTIQYQFLSEKSRLRPYMGTGIQYYNSGKPGTGNNADALYNSTLSNRAKYINIIFTEGLIYDVTPNLQITQSIHIIPELGIKPVGINFGIGYRIK
jgi:serine protease inhibitor ecotin